MEKEVVVKFPEHQFYSLCNFLQLLVVAGLEVNGTGNAVPTKEELKEIWRTMIKVNHILTPRSMSHPMDDDALYHCGCGEWHYKWQSYLSPKFCKLEKKVKKMPAKKKNIPLRRYLTKPKFHCEIRIEDSSWIDIIQYDPDSKVLEALLKSGTGNQSRYRYRNVSALVFSKVITAKSSGKAFNKYIKPRAFVNLTK